MEEFLFQYPYLYPLIFVAMWVGVLQLLSKMGGWSALSNYYETDAPPDGETRMFQSLSMGGGPMPANYSGIVSVTVSPQYLGLSIFVLFRPGHPPLKIPLSDLTIEPGKKILGMQAMKISAIRAPDVKILINRNLAQWIADNSSGALTLPEAGS